MNASRLYVRSRGVSSDCVPVFIRWQHSASFQRHRYSTNTRTGIASAITDNDTAMATVRSWLSTSKTNRSLSVVTTPNSTGRVPLSPSHNVCSARRKCTLVLFAHVTNSEPQTSGLSLMSTCIVRRRATWSSSFRVVNGSVVSLL